MINILDLYQIIDDESRKAILIPPKTLKYKSLGKQKYNFDDQKIYIDRIMKFFFNNETILEKVCIIDKDPEFLKDFEELKIENKMEKGLPVVLRKYR